MQAVAGDPSALQPIGQLSGEEHITQLAAAVGLNVVPGGLTQHQIFLGSQQREVNVSKAVQERSHGDYAARSTLLQSL